MTERLNSSIPLASISNPPITIKAVESFEDLNSYSNAWNDLALEANVRVPTLSHAWIASFLESQLQPGEHWTCLFAFDKNILSGVLPLITAERHTLGMRRTCMYTPYNKHTACGDFLLRPGMEKPVLLAFTSHIKNYYPECSRIKLERVPDWSPTLEAASNGLKGYAIHKEFHSLGSFIKVQCDFGAFQDRLAGNFRRSIHRLERRLGELGEIKSWFLEGSEATPDYLERFIRVEGSGWKGQRGSAIISSPQLIPFYKALTLKLSALGWLEWHFLTLNGRDIAAHLAVHMGRTLTLFKIGYDQYYSNCAPGNLLFWRMLERIHSCGNIDEINCLLWNPWNDRWRVERNNYYDLYLIPRRPMSILTCLLPLKTRVLLRRIPGVRQTYNFVKCLLPFG